MKYYFTFESTSQAMKADSIFKDNGIAYKVRPLPNEISSGCGICLVVDDLEEVRELIIKKDIKFNRLYQFDKVYSEIKL